MPLVALEGSRQSCLRAVAPISAYFSSFEERPWVEISNYIQHPVKDMRQEVKKAKLSSQSAQSGSKLLLFMRQSGKQSHQSCQHKQAS